MRLHPRRSSPSSLRRIVGCAALAAGIGVVASGCSWPGCTEPELVAEPLVVEDPEAPVTLAARLLDDGEPVPGRTVTFFVNVGGGPGQASGVRAGQAETEADGWARVSREDGVYGPALSDDVVEGYTVEFKPVGRKGGGPYHCPTEAAAPILCGDEQCPPKPWP